MQKNKYEQADNSVLDFYRQYSTYTDPGEYTHMYENLPDSLPALCSLIKSPDADNLSILREKYSCTPVIQITMSFESISENSDKNTGVKEK